MIHRVFNSSHNYTSLCKDKVNDVNFIKQNDDCQGL